MRRFPSACLIAVVFALSFPAGPAGAHSLEDRSGALEDRSGPRQLLEETTRDIIRQFELLMQSVPQYRAPEILDNGDIIIRRIPPRQKVPVPPPGTSPGREDQNRTKT